MMGEEKNINAKLNAISGMLRLGHEAFEKGSLSAACVHMLNNSLPICHYDRSCLVDMSYSVPKIIEIMGHDSINGNSEFCDNMKMLLRPFFKIQKITRIDKAQLRENHAGKRSIEAFDYFKKSYGENILLVPLYKPGARKIKENLIIWVMEFKQAEPYDTASIIALLGQHYSEALWYYKKKAFNIPANLFKSFTPLKTFVLLFIIFMFCLFLVHINENVAAGFELIPQERQIYYAPFSGLISSSTVQSGTDVNKGQLIIQYDTRELKYNLEVAKQTYNEISSQMDLVRQNSFHDKKELGKVKLLNMEQKIEEVKIEKINWYLSESAITSSIQGKINIEDPYKWHGKPVKAGEKLFEVFSPHKLYAEIFLNEKDSAILSSNNKITLYLHSRPEQPIGTKIIAVSPTPTLTEKGNFSYIIKAQIKSNKTTV